MNELLAHASVTGHEARGAARMEQTTDGHVVVLLTDFWVAPGAPDVRLYVTPRADGVVDAAALDLGRVPDGVPDLIFTLPDETDVASLRSVVVHCTVYSVYFGGGQWEFLG